MRAEAVQDCLSNSVAKPTQHSSKHWFWDLVKTTWPVYTIVILASFLINMFGLATPLFIRAVYDRVVPNKAIDILWILTLGVLLALILDFILRTLRGYLIDRVAKSIDLKLSKTLFKRLIGMELSSRPASVGSLAHSMQAFEGFREFITSATISSLVDIPFIMVFLGFIAVLAGNLVLVPLLSIPLILVISLLIQRPLTQLIQQNFLHSTEKQALLIESLACAETIKAMRAESSIESRYGTMSHQAALLTSKTKFLNNLATHFALLAQLLVSVLIVILGVFKIFSGTLSVGTLLACTLLSSRALSPITQIVALINRYQQAKTGFLAVDQIMNLPIENPANSTSIHRPNLNGRIEFANLSFQYPSASLHSLQNISFNILAGEKVGIIGRMGSGKSTIEKMIMKFYQPTQGRILIDDVDLQKLDPAELRQQIGYVPQDVVLFKGSIKDNIRIGAPNASEAAILNAAELSGVMSFVGTDPQGLEREVGEGGKFLSGGQRQAIAIARALLIDPPIVLMDEPSNGMDETNTHLLMQRMQSFFAEKTLVLVTHKAALLKWVNRIIVMDNGVLVADGPRDAILERLSEGQIHLGY